MDGTAAFGAEEEEDNVLEPSRVGNKVDSVTTSCAVHVAKACLAHTPSHRSTQLCVLGLGLNLDGVVAAMLHEEIQRHGADHIFAIVLPDRAGKSLMSSLTKSIRYQLRRLSASAGGEPVPVHMIKEGTDTKERCQAYFRGGVVVTTSKVMCADLLHRRLAAEVVALCAVCFPSVGLAGREVFLWDSAAGFGTSLTNLAFCVEILLRGTNHGADMGDAARRASYSSPSSPPPPPPPPASVPFATSSDGGERQTCSPGRQAVPNIVFLSDNPVWMQYLVNRRQVGRERFTSLLHVGDIQLYPRFRLSVVQHFEKLAKTKPLLVDRTLVHVSNDAMMLEELLKKVLYEALSGLQSLEQRLAPHATTTSTTTTTTTAKGDQGGSRFPSGFGSVEDLDSDLKRLQPRVRARFEVGAGGASPRIEYEARHSRPSPSHGASPSSASASAWRHPLDTSCICFCAISKEVAQETASAELDTDLAVALAANGPAWPFKERVESLLDVRRLRRALHNGTQYDFILTLSHVLEKRTPRQRPGEVAPPPPSAPWTLSSHYGDIVTVATHRIGRIVDKRSASGTTTTVTDRTGTATATAKRDKEEEIVIDVDDEDAEEDVIVEESSAPTGQPTSTLELVPNEEEQDNHLHLSHRLALAWVRDQTRKLARLAATAASRSSCSTEDEDPLSLAPAMLIIVFGPKEVQHMMQRLLYDPAEFRQRQLADFIERYQRAHGIRLVRHREAAVAPDMKGVAAQAMKKPRSADTYPLGDESAHTGGSDAVEGDGDDDDMEEETGSTMDDDREGFFDAEAMLEARADGGVDGGSQNHGLPREPGSAGGGGLALHHILLTQKVADGPADVQPPPHSPLVGGNTEQQSAPRLQLQYNSGSLAILAGGGTEEKAASSTALPALPRIIVSDGSTLRSGNLLAMIHGDHPLLQRLMAAEAGNAGFSEGDQPATAVAGTGGAKATGPLAVRRIILTRQSVPALRQLEMLQEELDASLLRRVKVQLVATTFSEAEGTHMMEGEKASFQSLANTKATLTGRMLMDRSSVRRTEEMLEAGLAIHLRSAAGNASGWGGISGRRGVARSKKFANIAGQFVGSVEAKKPEAPLIIFDEREFRSMLPYRLYTHGMNLVPLTLNTADYVLSPRYGMERKSVSDFFQSILGQGRINEQLTALSRRYECPLLLIEFDRGRPFRLLAGTGGSTAATTTRYGGASSSPVYVRLARVVASHTRVSILWSRSPAHSAGMISTLKMTVAEENPDPADSTLTGGLYAGGDEGDDGPGSEAAKALRHYAMRVLAKFPGVNSGNAETVMRLCGSLVGLAEISKDALLRAIGEEDGEELFEFLHSPFTERHRTA